jgi:hypothetical protein
MAARWIAFRDVPGAPVGATLPIGVGWRGGPVHNADEPEQLDRLVDDAASAAQTAFGLWSIGHALYGVAAHGEEPSIRFALNAPEGSESWVDLRDRCGVGASPARWRQQTALRLADWTVHTPRASDPLELDAVLQSVGDPDAVAASWFELLGLAMPVDREPDPMDQAALARAALTQAAERRRQRRINPQPTW